MRGIWKDGRSLIHMTNADETVFERDWNESEVRPFITEYGLYMRALDDLDIPSVHIEAIENQAKASNQPISTVVKKLVEKGLLYA